VADVVISGIGTVSPFGVGTDEFWTGLLAGRSATTGIDAIDSEAFDLETTVAAPVEALAPDDHAFLDEGITGRFAQFAAVAADEAIADATLDPETWDSERVGTCVGTAAGGLEETAELLRAIISDEGRFSSKSLFRILPYTASGIVSMLFGTRGPSKAPAASCAAGMYAICQAVDDLRAGHTDVVIAGGADAGVCPPVMAAIDATREHSRRNDDPAAASRPFDADRDGLVTSEGSAILVLETAEHAAARNVDPYATVEGVGMTSDPDMLNRPPESRGLTRAMDLALEAGGIDATDVDAVFAHATSTVGGDRHEARAITNVFDGSIPPVTALEASLGHALGASGAFLSAAAALAVDEGAIPPTINHERTDPQCDLPVVTQPIDRPLDYTICNSSGFGRANASVLLGDPGRGDSPRR
jgi:3-oxoacyl-[acyl-carrier-protein] synthase II